MHINKAVMCQGKNKWIECIYVECESLISNIEWTGEIGSICCGFSIITKCAVNCCGVYSIVHISYWLHFVEISTI